MDVHDRILKIIEYSGLSRNAFSLKIGIQPQTLHHIIAGRKTKPSFDVVEKIISTFSYIDPTWFLTGNGSMLKNGELFNEKMYPSKMESDENLSFNDNEKCTPFLSQKCTPSSNSIKKMGGDFGGEMGGDTTTTNMTPPVSIEERAERKIRLIEAIENEDWEKSINIFGKIDQLLRANKLHKIDDEIIDIQGNLSLCESYFYHYSATSQIHDTFVKYLKGEVTKQELNNTLKKASDISRQVHEIAIKYKDSIQELYEEMSKFNDKHDRLYCYDDLPV